MDLSLRILNKYRNEGLLYSQVHPTLPLTIWNYTEKVQYEGLWDEVTLSCRGLVTDDKGIVVARPFRKFFNIEEGKHIPTSSFEVYEKMDGSLIIVFWYDGGWVVASRGSFSSDQAVAASKIFFDKLDHNFSIGITYLFEFTAKWNRIVVDYGDEDNLTLLGAIRTDDETEATYEQLEMIARGANCDVVKRYDGTQDYSTLKGIIKDNQEGFVIRFSNGDRMKIKGEEYLRLHKIMTNLSTTAIWEVLSNGGSMDDLLKDVPDEFYNKIKEHEDELKFMFNSIGNDYNIHFRNIQNLMDKVGGDRRNFAHAAKQYKHPSILFGMLDGKDVSPIIWKIIKPEFKKL
jgi:T4 RnlA family RNA ligase